MTTEADTRHLDSNGKPLKVGDTVWCRFFEGGLPFSGHGTIEALLDGGKVRIHSDKARPARFVRGAQYVDKVNGE